MSQVDKIKVGDTTYNIAANADSTSTFTSSDTAQGSATAWSGVDQLNSGETNHSIFSKISTMFKNIRYLYNVLGTGFSTGSTVTSQMNGKAPSSHSHTVAQLPTSSTQINSNSYVPTSALIYQMNQTLTSLNDAYDPNELNDIKREIDILYSNIGDSIYEKDPPNNRPYDTRLVATLNNTTDTNNFCNKYRRNNAYKVNSYDKLFIGSEIQINDGTYNKRWIVAGFDLESARSGDGIFLIPKEGLTDSYWNDSDTSIGGYKDSYIRKIELPLIENNLNKVLGKNLVSRRVNIDGNDWIDQKCTLMSRMQVTGQEAYHYDDGEANYKLPVFNHMDLYNYIEYPNYFWSRNVGGNEHTAGSFNSDSYDDNTSASNYFEVRPLIMIR